MKPYQDLFKKEKLGSFDKVLVARSLQSRLSDPATTIESLGDGMVKAFESLFKAINDRLGED